MKPRHLEDFRPGDVTELGSRTVSRDEIVEFATRYDPQPFHIDEDAARHSMYGGLIASGWHTVAMLMRLAVDGLLGDSSSLGSPGVDEIRWLKPVRPGDTLTARATVVESVPSRSRPDRGHTVTLYELFNQTGDLV